MVATTFKGKFYYYENINGKEKKVEKSFTDPKKYAEFTQKHPMPSLASFFGLSAPTPLAGKPAKKALPVKKAPAKKKVAKKK